MRDDASESVGAGAFAARARINVSLMVKNMSGQVDKTGFAASCRPQKVEPLNTKRATSTNAIGGRPLRRR